MQNVLLLVALVTVAYILAHRVVERLQSRFLVSNGAEYILVGLMLGPMMPWPAAIDASTLEAVSPLVTLAIGWVGLVYGMQASASTLGERKGAVQLAMWEWVVTGAIVASGTWLLIDFVLPELGDMRAFLMGILAATATVGSASVVDLVQRRFAAEGALTSLLGRSARIGELLAIVTFGVMVCFYHQPIDTGSGTWDYANWLVMTFGLGGGLGVMFRLFVGDEHDPNKQFLAILGIVVFASGAAYELLVSPLLVNLVLGMVLANTAPNADELRATLSRYQPPMVIILLIFAGLMWQAPSTSGLVLAGAYVLLRLAGKVVGGYAAGRASQGATRSDVGRGLIGHGEVAVAMAISATLFFPAEQGAVITTAVLLSVFFNEIWAARSLRALLIDGGEITAEGDLVDLEATLSEPEGA